MNITIAPKGILQIDDARIMYRNFKGLASKYNREGDKNFSLVIPSQDIANELVAAGWNVKIKPNRDEGEDPFITLPIKVKFNDRGPKIYIEANGVRSLLDEENCGLIDDIDIRSVSMDVRPYDWEVNGKTGRSAYLQSMLVIQEVDRFAVNREEDLPF